VPDYKILHDSGYNVLAYDLRNHGRKAGNHDVCSGAARINARVLSSIRVWSNPVRPVPVVDEREDAAADRHAWLGYLRSSTPLEMTGRLFMFETDP
jgi:hypothetical protein